MIRAATEKESHLGMPRFLSYRMITQVILAAVFVLSDEKAAVCDCPQDLAACWDRVMKTAAYKEFVRDFKKLPKEDQDEIAAQHKKTAAGRRFFSLQRKSRANPTDCGVGLEICRIYPGLVEWLNNAMAALLEKQEPSPPPDGVYSRWRGAVPGILSGSPPRSLLRNALHSLRSAL